MKYDREHKDSLLKYPELKERMQSLLQNGEVIGYNKKNLERELQNKSRQYNRQ
ncbi:MAG: hypothetical protein HFH72_12845 [Lachnospiraceae bacterium]|nr:hypothetical protein [Lachnospiraceae bacterium]